MNKSLIFITFLILLTCCVSAEDIYYKKNTTVDVKVPCIYNNSYCSAITLCNITINYPNGSVFVANQYMTNHGDYHNYTLPNSNIEGIYESTMFCTNGVVSGIESFNFRINTNGDVENKDLLSTVIPMGLLIILCIGLTIFFYLTRSPLRYMFFLLTFIFTTVLMYMIYKFAQYSSLGIANVVYVLYWGLLIITWMIFLIIMIELTIMLWAWWSNRKTRGFRENF